MRIPIRLRLTLWYTALLACAIALFALTVYLVMDTTLDHNLDGALKQRIVQTRAEVHDEDGRISISTREETADEPSIPVVLLAPDGSIAQGALPPEANLWLRQHVRSLGQTIGVVHIGSIRLAVAPVVRGGRVAGYLVVWQSTKSIQEAKRTLLLVLLLAGPALLLIAGLGGFALAARALRPVSLLTHTASAISATDLRRRVPVGDTRDELSELAVTFNAMIDRLESAVQREKSFTGAASHELRAPLAVIRAEATLALDRPRTSREYRDALAGIDERAAAMEDLIAALLVLARLESSPSFEREWLAIADLVEAAVDQALPAVPHPPVEIDEDIPEELEVEGSASLLVRALRNLIENALKASPPNGTIRVSGRWAHDRVLIAVCDQGPGIAEEDQQRIFEPFFQVDTARTPGTSHGLGLAICRRIMAAHGGNVSVQSAPGHGACFQLELPLGVGSTAAHEPSRRTEGVSIH